MHQNESEQPYVASVSKGLIQKNIIIHHVVIIMDLFFVVSLFQGSPLCGSP